jgi:DNA-binding NarL/FixJ family response regulator
MVDDHPVVRVGIRAALASLSEFYVVGEADNADDALSLAAVHRPDVVFLDIKISGEKSGVDLARELRSRHPESRIVVFTNYSQEPYIKALFEIGVDGYLLKDTPPAEIVHTLQMVLQGRGVYSDRINATLVRGYLGKPGGGQSLSGREAEVLQLVADGKTNKEIAAAMHLSVKGIQLHLTTLYSKLGARNRTEALVLAARSGLIVIDE